MAQREGRGEPRYSSTFSITSVLDGSGWLTPLYPREGNPEHIVQKAGWTLGTVEPAADNFTYIGIRNLNRPGRRTSLYRLRYPGHGNDSYI